MNFLEMSNKHLIYNALQMWINHIQTGDCIASVNDVFCEEVKRLETDQMRLIIRLEEVKIKILKGE